jgi:serine/threonine-protein kinase
MAALMYQIINLDPHPLTIRVPGLPPAVEPVLRRALSKRPTERFSSMRDFSRAFEAAAFGRPADATPTPVLVSLAPPPGATIAYGVTPAPGKPGRSPAARTPRDANRLDAGPSAARTPQDAHKPDGDGSQTDDIPVRMAPVRPPAAARAPRDARKPDADVSQTDDDSTQVLPRKRIKPIYAVVAAVGVLLLGAFLLLRSGSAPKPTATSPVQPVVTPLLQPPAPPAVAAPEPIEAKPAVTAPAPPRAKRAKWVDPFSDTAKPKPAKATAPKSPQPKGKRKLIEEL